MYISHNYSSKKDYVKFAEDNIPWSVPGLRKSLNEQVKSGKLTTTEAHDRLKSSCSKMFNTSL